MTISRTTALNKIEIWQPRYKDRKVLISTYKVGNQNSIIFTKAKHLLYKEYYITGEEIRKCTLETNGTISCYAVPMDKLQLIERS